MSVREKVVENFEWIKRISRQFCNDRAEASDLAAETIVKCLDKECQFEKNRSFRPWAFTIMANTFKTMYNRKKCIPFAGYEIADNISCRTMTDEYARHNDLLSRIMALERTSRGIRSVMLYIEGYTYSEIAVLTGVSIDTVKTRIFYGRKRLREGLADFMEE